MRRTVAILVAVAVAAAVVAIAVALISGGGPGPSGQVTSGPGGHTRPRPVLPPLPTPKGEQFGANAGSLFERPTPLPAGVIAAALAALKADGATVVREDALWDATEPQAPVGGVHRYDWRFDDTIAAALAAQGLRWLPVIDYAPGWADASAAVGAVHPPPGDPAAYAAYAAAFATRYGPGGAFWRARPDLRAAPVDAVEIWNEPDNPTFWYPHPNLLAYAVLYTRAQQAIAAAAPAMHVLLGGLNHPDSSLTPLVSALRALHARVDGIAIHPYAATPAGVLANVRAARRKLRALDLGDVPLEVTEFGWTVSPPGALDYVSPALRPGYVQRTLVSLAHTNCQIDTVTVFSWVSLERSPLSYTDWFGLANSPADRQAFAAGVREATAAGPVRPAC